MTARHFARNQVLLSLSFIVPCVIFLQQEGRELTKEEKQRLRKEKKQQKKQKGGKEDKTASEHEQGKGKKQVASPESQKATRPPTQKGFCFRYEMGYTSNNILSYVCA